jgi:hypothetical protein
MVEPCSKICFSTEFLSGRLSASRSSDRAQKAPASYQPSSQPLR